MQRLLPSYRPLLPPLIRRSSLVSSTPWLRLRRTSNPPTSPIRLTIDGRRYKSAPRGLLCQVESDASCPTPPKRRCPLCMDPLVWNKLISIGWEWKSYARYIFLILPCLLSYQPSLFLLSLRKLNDTALSMPSHPPSHLEKHHIPYPYLSHFPPLPYDAARSVAGRTLTR
jgi:hypothetical protein